MDNGANGWNTERMSDAEFATHQAAAERNSAKYGRGPGGASAGPAGWPSLPGSFADMINFEGAFTDFMGAYEEIRAANKEIFEDINKDAEADAKRLGVSFTEANLANFETAMERVQPGYKGLLNKTTGVVQDWLFGRIPEDVATNVLMQASNRALRSGIGEGGFARNLLARDFGMTSLQLQQAGVGQAQQLVNSARQTSRSLIANVEALYGTNLSARANSQMMSPAQYVGMVAEQDQFNAQGEFQESQAKAQMEQQYSQFAYQDALNRFAATYKPKKKSGVFGDIFGDSVGSVLDPIADIAIPTAAAVFGGPLAGAAAGAAWGGMQAQSRGGDMTQGALMGGVMGYGFGSTVSPMIANHFKIGTGAIPAIVGAGSIGPSGYGMAASTALYNPTASVAPAASSSAYNSTLRLQTVDPQFSTGDYLGFGRKPVGTFNPGKF